MPESINISELNSWTGYGSEELESFSGTAKYSVNFTKPQNEAKNWILNLGKVRESAVIYLNGDSLATLICRPFQVIIPDEKIIENNVLEIKVSNLMANHIAHLDKNDIVWKKFYNINFPARRSVNRGEDGHFTAINWEPMESGLIGPVTISPAKFIEFE